MFRLIKANFYSIFKSVYFYILMLLSAVIAAVFTIGIYYSPEATMPPGTEIGVDLNNVLSFAPSLSVIIVPFIAAACVGLFLESEYTQGAIRNKLVCGHTRFQVFFSQLITVCITTLIFFALFEATVFGISIFAFDYSDYDVKTVFAVLGTILLMVISSSTMLSFMIGSFFHGGKLIAVLLGCQYGLEFVMVLDMFKKDNKILDFITRCAPQGSLFRFTYSEIPDKLALNAIIAVSLIIIFIVIGFGKFRKGDIK